MARRIHEHLTDGVVTKREYWSLREEVMRDIADEWRLHGTQMFDVAPNTITDIDSFRLHWKPERIFNQHLLDQGYTQQQINSAPQIVKDAFILYARFAMAALLFNHGKIPGGSGPATWDDREAIP